MSTPSLRVAVVGASRDRSKFGNKAVRAYRKLGLHVWPVNPKELEIESVPAVSTLEAIGEQVDVVSLYVPPPVGVKLLPSIAALHPREVWANPGTESVEFLEKAAELGLRVIRGCSIVALGLNPGLFPDA